MAASAAAAAGFGAVLEFPQANGEAEIDYSTTSLSTASATYEIWIKTSVTSKQMLFQTAYTQPFIYIENNQIAVQWVGANSDPNYRWVSADTAVISDGEWHHIAVVFNNNAITFYKDGIATADTLSVNQSEITNHPVFMGGAWADVPAFTGQMWDIKIWSFAFTAPLIQADMFNAIPPIELAALRPKLMLSTAFNVANNTITNLVNGATGTLTNCEVTWDVLPQPPSYAFELPGGGAYVDLGNMSEVSSAAATFECWIQMSTAAGVNTKAQTILLFRGSDPSGASPRIEYDPVDKLGVYWNTPGAYSTDTRPISDGAWHHIAVVFNNNVVTFYKDGIPTNETFTLPATQTSGNDPQVGPGLGSTEGFNGRITDVRVWNVARALSDIQGNMYSTLAGTEPGLVMLNNLSTYSPSNTAITNMVNGSGGALAGNASVVQVVGPQSQQPVPQSVWTYPIPGIAPLGPQMSPQGLFYAENVSGSTNGSDGAYLRSLDLQDHTLNWSYLVKSADGMATPVIPASVAVGNGAVYVGAQNSEYSFGTIVQLHSVNTLTGQPVWVAPTFFVARSFACRPVVAGARVVIGVNMISDPAKNTVDTVLASVNVATGAYQPGLAIQVGSAVNYMTDPLVGVDAAGNTIAYFGTNFSATSPGLVYAVDLDTNKEVWGTELGAPLTAVAVTDQYVYAVCQNGDIFALNRFTTDTIVGGSIAWRQNKSSSSITSKPVVIGTAVYIGSTDGNLYALDGATGNELWRLNAGSQITTDLITEDGAIYFATQGNGAELPPTFFSVDAASFGNDTLIYPVPDADTILFDQGQSNGVVYFYSKQNVYAVNMDQILHEFNVDTKLTVEDYDTSTSDPAGNDTSYRITLALNDPMKVPRVNQAVKIWASGTVYLTNWLDSSGNPTVIGPDTPFLVQTNANGEVSLAVSAYDDGSHGGSGSTASPLVNCPAIYAWANFMMPGEAIVIYPDHEHLGQLSNVQGQAPSQAQVARSYAVASTLYLNQASSYEADPNNPPTYRKALLLPSYKDSQSLTDIASTIRNTIGTRNPASTARVTNASAVGDANSKYIAYPASMPNVNYASDNTQPVTRPYVPAGDPINQTFTIDVSNPSGGTVYQAGKFDNSPPANSSKASGNAGATKPTYVPTYVPTSTRRIHIQGIGEVEAIDSIGDFFRHVIKGAERVAKLAWTWTTNAVNTVIHTAENIYTLVINTVEDAVTAVVGFIKSVVADIKKAIEWLSALFDLKDMIANHNLIKSYVTNSQGTGMFDKMQAWIKNEIQVLGSAQSDITNMFGQVKGNGKSNMQTTGNGVAGQTVQSQQGPNSNPNDAYNTGGNNNATQCKWMHHKVMENGANTNAPQVSQPQQLYIPHMSTGLSLEERRAAAGRDTAAASSAAMPPISGQGVGGVSDGPDPDVLIQAWVTFAESIGKTIADDFVNFPAQLQAAIDTFKDKFKDPKSMLGNAFSDLLAVLAVLADDMINLGVEIAAAFLQMMDTILAQIVLWMTQAGPDIPFVSRLYKALTGQDMTYLDLMAMLLAVPATILLEVATGVKTPGAALEIQAQSPHAANLDPSQVLNIFLGIVNFIEGALGGLVDGYSFFISASGVYGPQAGAFIAALDLIANLFGWVVGMAVSFAWNEWKTQDWCYWGMNGIPLVYNAYSFFLKTNGGFSANVQATIDTIFGTVKLVTSAVFAGLWPKNYLNAPKAPTLNLFANIFSSLGYIVEVVYFSNGLISQPAAASLVWLGKIVFEEVSAILGFTGYVLTVLNPSSTLTALPPAMPASPTALLLEAPKGNTHLSSSFA